MQDITRAQGAHCSWNGNEAKWSDGRRIAIASEQLFLDFILKVFVDS
jgi:hypothetical protein